MYFLQHYSGLDEAVYRNIDACKELAATTASAYGPLGKCQKQVVYEHLGLLIDPSFSEAHIYSYMVK